MKISELNSKSFLGAPGAVANSYVLINYEDNTTSEPVTYKATVEELGKAIANNLKLYKDVSGSAAVINVNNGAYVDGSTNLFVTSEEKANIAKIPSLESYMNTIPSIVTSEINSPKNGIVVATSYEILANGNHVANVALVNSYNKLEYYPSMSASVSYVTMKNIAPHDNCSPVFVTRVDDKYWLVANTGVVSAAEFTYLASFSMPSDPNTEPGDPNTPSVPDSGPSESDTLSV